MDPEHPDPEAQKHFKYITSAMELVTDSCLDVVSSVLEGEEKDRAIDELRGHLGDLVRHQCDFEDSLKALDLLGKRISRASQEDDFTLDVDQVYREEKGPVAREATEATVAKSRAMTNFEESVARLSEDDRPLLEEGADGDIVATKVLTSLVDPLTKRQIRNPVRNSRCGHVYDRDTMLSVIERNSCTRCPYAGCPNGDYVTEDHLVSDAKTRRALHRANRNKYDREGASQL